MDKVRVIYKNITNKGTLDSKSKQFIDSKLVTSEITAVNSKQKGTMDYLFVVTDGGKEGNSVGDGDGDTELVLKLTTSYMKKSNTTIVFDKDDNIANLSKS